MNKLGMQIGAGVMTILQEAANQPYAGKLAVAYVIRNSCKRWGRTITDEVFRRNRYSCWRDDSPTTLNLDEATEPLIAECTKAMLAAWYYLEEDPTNGACYYMNVDVVRRSRGGTLPGWWASDTNQESEVKIGDHTFRGHRDDQESVVV
jgi:hypothetical protein